MSALRHQCALARAVHDEELGRREIDLLHLPTDPRLEAWKCGLGNAERRDAGRICLVDLSGGRVRLAHARMVSEAGYVGAESSRDALLERLGLDAERGGGCEKEGAFLGGDLAVDDGGFDEQRHHP